ncbi:hypothetical protein BC962_0222 [Gillisia mitskevichiae]|uniref:DUF5689 domain-containing protein n=1 Tax=Gillisia mitskevichiae TaxID=270921 RepID=A0A495PY76_9FLAO|nr:DUF5689 domain-containing protein [Gillisia mitskevichiae]RKS55263.1 hypothetical protein BC962_0222 [Gillisia mitskevichiae]
MERFKKYSFLGGLVVVLFMNSCVKTDDFSVPESNITEDGFEGNLTSISGIKGNYNPTTGDIYTFNNTEAFIEGFVISSDEAGNFYKKLIIQDRASNPTSGIQILVDNTSLFSTYEFGRKIYVKLDGLSLGFNNGVFQLGIQNRENVVAIPLSLLDEHIIRSSITSEIEPISLDIIEFNEAYRNLFVRLENVQFNKNLIRDEKRFTFAAEVTDRFDGERQIESCSTGSTSFLSTSTFSDFKSLLLPQFSGSVEGVLTRNFYDDHFVVILNSPEDLQFDEGSRCDPEFLKCGQNETVGNKVLFEENFVGISNENILDGRGWTNVNIYGGNERFEDGILNSDRFIRISAYGTSENPLEAWLITPAINLNNSVNEILSVDIKSSYDNGVLLSVLISKAFTGNPRTTEWQLLDANIPIGPSNQYGPSFKKSMIDISCLEGTIHVAFKYLGAAPDKTTTYDIDNIRITGN